METYKSILLKHSLVFFLFKTYLVVVFIYIQSTFTTQGESCLTPYRRCVDHPSFKWQSLFYFTEGKQRHKKFCVLLSVSLFVTIEIRTFQFIEINRANGYAFFPSNFSLSGEKQPLNNSGPADCKTCFWLHTLSITSA